jgi:hypothetical protein
MSIRDLLTQADRRWEPEPGADESTIQRLCTASPAPLPEAFLDLLRFSNGGEGDLALPPLLFMLDAVDEIVKSLNDSFLVEEFPGFLFFGGNGGLERIAFDLRGGSPPWPIMMIDPIAGPESARVIAPSIESFIQAIGRELPDSVVQPYEDDGA